jgi:hypothetical protein
MSSPNAHPHEGKIYYDSFGRKDKGMRRVSPAIGPQQNPQPISCVQFGSLPSHAALRQRSSGCTMATQL